MSGFALNLLRLARARRTGDYAILDKMLEETKSPTLRPGDPALERKNAYMTTRTGLWMGGVAGGSLGLILLSGLIYDPGTSAGFNVIFVIISILVLPVFLLGCFRVARATGRMMAGVSAVYFAMLLQWSLLFIATAAVFLADRSPFKHISPGDSDQQRFPDLYIYLFYISFLWLLACWIAAGIGKHKHK